MIAVPLALAAAWLVWAAHRHPRWPAWRTAAGLAGLAALGAAGLVGDARLSSHMLEHQLIDVVAAPLLVLAAPVRLALGTLGREGRRGLARAAGSWLPRTLTHPVVALAGFAGVLAVVHVPAVYDAALRSPVLHALEHGALFWSSAALWVPMIGAEPVGHRTGMVTRVSVLVGAMSAMGILGAIIAEAPAPLYPAYPDVADQQLAGGLMWVGGMVVVVPLVLVAAWNALIAEERRQRAREARP